MKIILENELAKYFKLHDSFLLIFYLFLVESHESYCNISFRKQKHEFENNSKRNKLLTSDFLSHISLKKTNNVQD